MVIALGLTGKKKHNIVENIYIKRLARMIAIPVFTESMSCIKFDF